MENRADLIKSTLCNVVFISIIYHISDPTQFVGGMVTVFIFFDGMTLKTSECNIIGVTTVTIVTDHTAGTMCKSHAT